MNNKKCHCILLTRPNAFSENILYNHDRNKLWYMIYDESFDWFTFFHLIAILVTNLKLNLLPCV